MLKIIKSLLGIGPKVNFAELLKQGATIIDVRTVGEFKTGHIANSINIPLQNLQSNLNKINKNKPVITCCASGARSGVALNLLKSNGYTEVYNGGGWLSLKSKIR